jgi:transmembrane sensor
VTQNPLNDDPAWAEALDWFFRIQARPGDARLLAERDAWLAGNAANARAYERAERVWRLTGDVPAVHAAPLENVVPLRRESPRRRVVALAGAALAACLAIAAFLPTIATHLRADHLTRAAETRHVALADGSSVHLDAASAVSIGYSQDRRGIALLEGRAFFEVAPNAAQPFTVAAGDVTVTVTGTAFDVNLTADRITVEVQSGSVNVDIASGAHRDLVALKPGERAVANRATGALTRGAVDRVDVASWRSGRLVVDGATIAEVIAEFDRHYRGAIVILDDDLAQRRVTGVFDLHDPAGALRAVVQPHKGRLREVTPYLLIVSAAG